MLDGWREREREREAKDEYENFMNKIPYIHIMGCATALAVGAWTKNAKAVYPEPSVVEAHWRQNPRVFQETFAELFPQAEQLHLWREGLPDWVKNDKNRWYHVLRNDLERQFYTDSDLEELPCDAELKKIIKVIGSLEFLESVLPESVVQSIYAYATGGEEFQTEFCFVPCYKKEFFDALGGGSLCMEIQQRMDGETVCECYFQFDFEKRKDLTILKNYSVNYCVGDEFSKNVEYIAAQQRLSDFPWAVAKEAKQKFSAVYAKLRDDFNKHLKRYCECKINDKVDIARERLKEDIEERFGNSDEKKSVSAMLRIMVTEDFLEGIFRKKFRDILTVDRSNFVTGRVLTASLNIAAESDGKIPISFEFYQNYRGGKNRTDFCSYSCPGTVQDWEWCNFNYIRFWFLFDPKNNEISHVRLQNQLILNDELITKCIPEETLLEVDRDEGFCLPKDVLKENRGHAKQFLP